MSDLAVRALKARKKVKVFCVIGAFFLLAFVYLKTDFVDLSSFFIGLVVTFIVMTILDLITDPNREMIDFVLKGRE